MVVSFEQGSKYYDSQFGRVFVLTAYLSTVTYTYLFDTMGLSHACHCGEGGAKKMKAYLTIHSRVLAENIKDTKLLRRYSPAAKSGFFERG